MTEVLLALIAAVPPTLTAWAALRASTRARDRVVELHRCFDEHVEATAAHHALIPRDR